MLEKFKPKLLEYCPNCKEKSLFWNQRGQIWECLNRRCQRTYTSSEFSEYWYNKQAEVQPTQQRQTTQRTRQVFEAPLWLVNIFESKRVWSILICLAVVCWCWMGIQYSRNSLGEAIGIAFPVLLLYIIKLVLRRYLHNYNTLARQHTLSPLFYSIRKSSFLRLCIILVTIALLATTIWSIFSFISNLIQDASVVYLLNITVLIAAQIWLLNWLCKTLKHSRNISQKPRFAVVFWSVFAGVTFCAFIGINPLSDIKDNATTSIGDWWEQTTIATKTPAEPQPEPPPENLTPPQSVDSNSGITNFSNVQPPYAKTLNGPNINLVNNPHARDPTWKQLLTFLSNDTTDKKSYNLLSFPCGAFAEEVQNNAEATGIRASWVGIDFVDSPTGHAVNAFNTTDRGLVFVDCVGECCSQISPRYQAFGSKTYASPNSWDKIAYIEVGKECGFIAARFASSTDYSYYLQYCEDRVNFVSEVSRYNIEAGQYTQFISGRTFYIGSSDYLKATQWKQKLDLEKQHLDTLATSFSMFWEPLGVVSKVKIYW